MAGDHAAVYEDENLRVRPVKNANVPYETLLSNVSAFKNPLIRLKLVSQVS